MGTERNKNRNDWRKGGTFGACLCFCWMLGAMSCRNHQFSGLDFIASSEHKSKDMSAH